MKRSHGSRLQSFLSSLFRRSLFLLTSHVSLLTLFLLLCSPAVVFSQQRWERTWGGEGNDFGESAQQTTDGGFIIVGETNSIGYNCNVYLIKTDARGDTLWSKLYGVLQTNDGRCVQQTYDGGYIIAGGTWVSNRRSYDVLLIKTNAQGDTLWTKTYGDSGMDYGWSVQQTQDSGYVIAGETSFQGAGRGDVYLIKTDGRGDTLWTRAYGGAMQDRGFSVRQTRDGGYILAGETRSFGDTLGDVYVIRTNPQGDTLWTRQLGGNRADRGNSIQQTRNGNYILTGGTESFAKWRDAIYLVQLDSLGNVLWQRTYDGYDSEWGSSVRQTVDGGYVIAGSTSSQGAGMFDIYLIKTDSLGDTVWTKTYGGAYEDEGNSVSEAADGGYIIAGLTNSFGAGGFDFYIIKTDPSGNSGIEEANRGQQTEAQRGKPVPNPFVSYTILPGHESERFALYDITGRRVGTYKGDRVGEGLSPGVYFLRPFGEYAKPLRIVKLR